MEKQTKKITILLTIIAIGIIILCSVLYASNKGEKSAGELVLGPAINPDDLKICLGNWTKSSPIVFYNNSIDFIKHNETHHKFELIKNNTAIFSVFVEINQSEQMLEFFEDMIYAIMYFDMPDRIRQDNSLPLISNPNYWIWRYTEDGNRIYWDEELHGWIMPV